LNDANYANATWDSKTNSGEIILFDIPTLAASTDKTNIESYFVLKNYDNSGKDLIVARADWGFTADSQNNVVPIGKPSIQITNQFTPNDQAILNDEKKVILNTKLTNKFKIWKWNVSYP
jgi:hypothetical protein